MKVFSALQIEKGVDYSSSQLCVGCYFVSIRKIPTSLPDKNKRIIQAHPHFPTTLKTNQQWAGMM